MSSSRPSRTKVFGVGLNKTGTKTLRHFLLNWGYDHRSYDLEAFNRYQEGDLASLLEDMQAHDSFEDWPWPLLFREADEHFPDSRFILTVRKSPEIWYRSLCKMAVRMGPLTEFEKHIYGHSMPQGHKAEHLEFYRRHNEAVLNHFEGRPDRLLVLCWETGQGVSELPEFLSVGEPVKNPPRINQSMRVYGGDSLVIAQLNRVAFQNYWRGRRALSRLLKRG